MKSYLVVLVLTFAALVAGSCASTARDAEPVRIAPLPTTRVAAPPTIRRAALRDVLRAGPGRFFARMPVEPYRQGGRLVGHRILALYGGAVGNPEGVQIGDVVLAVNDLPIARPGQFMKVWQHVGTARELRVDVLRDGKPLRIGYRIID